MQDINTNDNNQNILQVPKTDENQTGWPGNFKVIVGTINYLREKIKFSNSLDTKEVEFIKKFYKDRYKEELTEDVIEVLDFNYGDKKYVINEVKEVRTKIINCIALITSATHKAMMSGSLSKALSDHANTAKGTLEFLMTRLKDDPEDSNKGIFIVKREAALNAFLRTAETSIANLFTLFKMVEDRDPYNVIRGHLYQLSAEEKEAIILEIFDPRIGRRLLKDERDKEIASFIQYAIEGGIILNPEKIIALIENYELKERKEFIELFNSNYATPK